MGHSFSRFQLILILIRVYLPYIVLTHVLNANRLSPAQPTFNCQLLSLSQLSALCVPIEQLLCEVLGHAAEPPFIASQAKILFKSGIRTAKDLLFLSDRVLNR